MSSQQYLDDLKSIQENLLSFLENETNEEENYQNLQKKIADQKIFDDKPKFKSLLHLLHKISNNHHRGPNFFTKIERIFTSIKSHITKYFNNWEIFRIFKSNKRILLCLVEEQIMAFDEQIIHEIKKKRKYAFMDYLQYFEPEIKKNYIEQDEKEETKKEIPENFYELRKIGENESQICKLIREDMIKEFIIFVNKNSISPNSLIQKSIYETNPCLYKNPKISLIRYATFFGALQIFKYLQIEGCEINCFLMFLAIHSLNAELIKLLEDNFDEKVKTDEEENFLIESIKCHHIEIANYFINNYFQNEIQNSPNIIDQSLKSYNFIFLENEFINESVFNLLCKYDYYYLVDAILKQNNVDVNKATICKI